MWILVWFISVRRHLRFWSQLFTQQIMMIFSHVSSASSQMYSFEWLKYLRFISVFEFLSYSNKSTSIDVNSSWIKVDMHNISMYLFSTLLSSCTESLSSLSSNLFVTQQIRFRNQMNESSLFNNRGGDSAGGFGTSKLNRRTFNAFHVENLPRPFPLAVSRPCSNKLDHLMERRVSGLM